MSETNIYAADAAALANDCTLVNCVNSNMNSSANESLT